MALNVLLMWVECAIHLVTFLIVFLYSEQRARQRWGVSAFAIGIAASNVGLFALMALGAFKAAPAPVHAILIMVFGGMLGLLVRSRGNVAKMIQPFKPRTPTT